MNGDLSSDDPDQCSGRTPSPLGSVTRRVPGAAANAPKRNVLVALAYLFGCLLTAGLLSMAL